ncbi:MAG TPA: hypothetical protein VEK57_28130 [Thermoanaerobaculia bacterium]|nr:hypothetical protein [Thermoanaerobaculia bacterium]
MKKNDASDRAAALVHQALDVLQRAIHAPASPVSAFVPAKGRRQLRRSAARLRAGKARPRYVNLHSSEELAGVHERTARRDEILEQGVEEFRQITFELGRVLEANDPAVGAALDALVRDTKRAAEEAGPGSAAAERYQQLLLLGVFGRQWHSRRRRQRGRGPDPAGLSLASDPFIEARYALSAAELLAGPPSPDEPVVAIPPEGGGSGRERMFFRIGTGASSWTGSFERGHQCVSTVFLMPDGKHLFVSAGGAGYVIEASSRTLVETLGTDVAGIVRDEPMTLFVVDHDGRSLEAFGRTGRVWKADRISSGGFRRLHFTGHALLGEARQWWRAEWVRFAVNLATGEVRLGR